MSSSASTESTGESLVIRVSSTMRRQYDPAFPNHVYGDCYPIDYVVVAPGVWLCVGFSDKAPEEELFNGWVWVYGRDLHWFSLGSEPIATWNDAVVLPTTIPGRLLVIPDKFYPKPIPRRFIIQRFLLGWFLPSVWGKVNKAWKQLGA
jgi:hypothetical protein